MTTSFGTSRAKSFLVKGSLSLEKIKGHKEFINISAPHFVLMIQAVPSLLRDLPL